jgi:AbrB family looped-hinge helix DNA binding protein
LTVSSRVTITVVGPGARERVMSAVTVDDEFRVAIPAGLRDRLGLRAGDRLEAVVVGDELLVSRKAAVDRAAAAARLRAAFARNPVASGDEGKSEEQVLAEVDAEIAAIRAERRQRQR